MVSPSPGYRGGKYKLSGMGSVRRKSGERTTSEFLSMKIESYSCSRSGPACTCTCICWLLMSWLKPKAVSEKPIDNGKGQLLASRTQISPEPWLKQKGLTEQRLRVKHLSPWNSLVNFTVGELWKSKSSKIRMYGTVEYRNSRLSRVYELHFNCKAASD